MNETDSKRTGKINATGFPMEINSSVMGYTLFLVSTLIISTNLLVASSLVLIIRKRGWRSWCFVLNLSLADTLVGLAITALAYDALCPSELTVTIMDCLLLMAFVACPSSASILTMFLISLDRYLAIKLPLRYARISNKWSTAASLMILWAVALVLGFLPCFVRQMQNEKYKDKCTFFSVIKPHNIIYIFCGCFFPVLVVFLYFYLDILKIACGHQRQIRQACKAGAHYSQPSRYWVHVKSLRTVALLVGCFTLSWCPFFTVSVVQVLCSNCELYSFLEGHLWLLGLSNSLVNPLVYACWQKEVRQQICSIFSHLKCSPCCWANRNSDSDRPEPTLTCLSRDHVSVPLTSLPAHDRIAVAVP